MYLYLDTADEESVVALLNSDFVVFDKEIWPGCQNQSEELLIKIDNLIERSDKSKNEMLGIFVNPGPGSYTGLRVGTATANALAFGLGVSVWVVDKETIDNPEVLKEIMKIKNKSVSPVYKKPPHITKSKRGHSSI